jgi:hypothetical protein
MSVGARIFFVSLFTGLPWLVAAGMAFWMVYQTTDPRAAEIGRNVQLSLMGSIGAIGLISLIVGWMCLRLYRRRLANWWVARFSSWVLLGLWIAMAVRLLSREQHVVAESTYTGKGLILVGFALLIVANLACISFLDRSRAVFDRVALPQRS